MRDCTIRIAFFAVALGLTAIVCASRSAADQPALPASPWASRPNTQIRSIANLPDDDLSRGNKLCREAMTAIVPERRHYLVQALEITQQHLDNSHCQVRHVQVLLRWYDWYCALDTEEIASFRTATYRQRDALELLPNGNYERAVSEFENVEDIYRKMEAPPLQEQIWLRCAHSFALSRMGKPQIALDIALDGYRMAESWYGDILSWFSGNWNFAG